MRGERIGKIRERREKRGDRRETIYADRLMNTAAYCTARPQNSQKREMP